MAVPKSRWSKARTRRGHSANANLKAPNLRECPECHELTVPHRVCKNCGTYKGRQIVAVDSES